MPEPTKIPVPSLDPDQDIFVEFGDHVPHLVSYSIATFSMLKAHLGGRPMTGVRSNLMNLDEDIIPDLIFFGVCDDKGNPPDGVTLERLRALPARFASYFLSVFSAAYHGALPEKKISAETMAILQQMVTGIKPVELPKELLETPTPTEAADSQV